MGIRKKRVKVKEINTLGKVKQAFFSTQSLPLLLTMAIMGVLFVLFRMKTLELDYKITDTKGEIKKVELERKELNANKARLLSVNNLRDFSKKYNLKQPNSNQIIVIPE